MYFGHGQSNQMEKKLNKDLVLREEMALERTKMANFRTLLAFLRTSLYFPVAGISMHEALNLHYGIYLQWGGISIGILLFVIGLIYYNLAKKKIKGYKSFIGNYPVDDV
jgi:putative membrane protein